MFYSLLAKLSILMMTLRKVATFLYIMDKLSHTTNPSNPVVRSLS